MLHLLLLVTSLHAQQYFFGNPIIRNYTPEAFKGGIQSWSIAQDAREVVYIANNFGLLEFDGATWNRYSVDNSTKVRSVHIGKNNRIYVGSQADFGYFKPGETGVLKYFSLADSLPQEYRNFDEVWRIYEINDCIYFLTFKYIYCYTPGKAVKVISTNSPLEFSFLVNKKIYSLAWNTGLSVLDGNRLNLVPGGEFFAQRQIASILPFDKEKLIIFTMRHGVYLYDGRTAVPFKLNDESLLKSSPINQVITLRDGSFAVATQNTGVVLLNREGEVLAHISKREGLLDNTVHTLYQDTQDNLWLGLNNGLSIIEVSSPFTRIDGTMGLSGTGYAAIKAGDAYYFGTNSGLFRLNKPKFNAKQLSLVPNSTGQVYHLRSISGQILMGHHNGPFVVEQDAARQIYPEKGAWDFISMPGNPDKLILGTYFGVRLLDAASGKLNLMNTFKGFEESSRVLDFDSNGDLWMAHGYKGLYRIKFDPDLKKIASIRFYNSKDGLPSDQLINMERVKNELIFPALYGIYRHDKATDKFVQDKALSALFKPDEHIVEMEEDIQGNIYFISDQRVGRLSFDKFGKPSIEEKLFNSIKDQLNDDLSYIHVLDLNNVLFGAKDGFIHFKADKVKEIKDFKTHLSSIVITSLNADSLLLFGRKIEEKEGTILPFDLNSLRFTYAASFFESPEKTRYQFFLENFDSGWSEWTNKTEKEYTNLPEGNYSFKVRAKNVYGAISEAKSFTFTVEPPFYRSKVSYVLYTFSGFLLIGLIFFQADKRFKKAKHLIIQDKEEMLSQKETELKEITTQSEQEIIRLRNEKLQFEVDHMNRELTYSTIHLMNKSELLNSIKLDLQGILKKGDKTSHQEELKKIIRSIDNNLNSEDDWKQFELHFNHVHGDFTNRLQERYPNLTPQEIKLCTYLRLNLTTKDIAQLLNISVRGVEISRYRLRKRLGLDRSENLTDFMLKF
ncbi:triple tyrosine motif-containing protein [Pontibacter sp. SGAir0037]|uniref:ligand-binding sensor domain-containing protein n=1 Tax=Pontibacter sp. SGAir0037 TaxID=2571030 RepID=UPI00143D52CD|nr:triple tyrosine motif-containing protein [Pontibacter sp. SGAir0037]